MTYQRGGRILVSSQTPGRSRIRLLNSSSIDFSILRAWLHFCQEMHTSKCILLDKAQVPRMKLIDCNTRKFVPAMDRTYSALSYCWGQANYQDTCVGDQLPSQLPATIEDAITVNLGLGLEYLWIDRYCVDKGNAEHASDQMRQMDLIYRNADVTIIAVGGKGPEYGLPGVGSRARTLPTHIMRVENTALSNANETPSRWPSFLNRAPEDGPTKRLSSQDAVSSSSMSKYIMSVTE